MPSCLPHALCTPHQECLCSPPETLPGTEGENSPPSYFQMTMGQLSDPRMNSTRSQYLTHLTVVPLDPCSPLGKPLSKVTQRTLAHLVRNQVLTSGLWAKARFCFSSLSSDNKPYLSPKAGVFTVKKQAIWVKTGTAVQARQALTHLLLWSALPGSQ